MKEHNVLSLTNPVRIPRVLTGRMSRPRTHAFLLTALALAAAAGCSSAGSASSAGAGAGPVSSTSAGTGSAAEASADQQAAAAVVVRTMHDFGTNNYADVCAVVAPGSSVIASGIEGCAVQFQASMTAARRQQSGAEAFLSKASELTVNPTKVVVDGDSATVPKTALLYQGKPVAQVEGMEDQTLIRKNGQWYLVVGS